MDYSDFLLCTQCCSSDMISNHKTKFRARNKIRKTHVKTPFLILNKDRYDDSLLFRLFAQLILIWFHFEKNFLATLRWEFWKKSSSIFMAGQPSFESFWHEPNVQSNFAECIFCSQFPPTKASTSTFNYVSSIFT